MTASCYFHVITQPTFAGVLDVSPGQSSLPGAETTPKSRSWSPTSALDCLVPTVVGSYGRHNGGTRRRSSQRGLGVRR